VDAHLQEELRQLLAETNDQRRRFGQVIYHIYRTLVFWGEHGASFAQSVRRAAPAGATLFDAMARGLADLEPQAEDVPLRSFVQDVLGRLAADLEGGERLRVAFLRWLEGRFPVLTRLMRDEDGAGRLMDHALAAALAQGFAAIADAAPEGLVAPIRRLAAEVAPTRSAGGRPRS
jgi:hypothetical protein